MTRQQLKRMMAEAPRQALIKALGDLYKMTGENARFLETCFATHDKLIDLMPYKRMIKSNICPNIRYGADLSLSKARQAISQCKRTTSNQPAHILELMVYYLEQGMKFTLTYGDINDAFYNSLCSMFVKAIHTLTKHPSLKDDFMPRLVAIIQSARDIGWGVYDSMLDELIRKYPEAKSLCNG